jgi:F0F1-type ATP synthase assembly protein I
VAFEFSGTIAVGAVGGWYVDSRFGTTPWGLVSMTLLAAVGGFVRLIQVLRRFDRVDAGPQS